MEKPRRCFLVRLQKTCCHRWFLMVLLFKELQVLSYLAFPYPMISSGHNTLMPSRLKQHPDCIFWNNSYVTRRPVVLLLYACTVLRPVWHASLTYAQTEVLETLQRRVMRIINSDDRRSELPVSANCDTLRARRQVLTERVFTRNVLKSDSCLHYLLPEMRDGDITDRLRNAKNI